MKTTRRILVVGGAATCAAIVAGAWAPPPLNFYLDGKLIGFVASPDEDWTWPEDATGVLI